MREQLSKRAKSGSKTKAVVRSPRTGASAQSRGAQSRATQSHASKSAGKPQSQKAASAKKGVKKAKTGTTAGAKRSAAKSARAAAAPKTARKAQAKAPPKATAKAAAARAIKQARKAQTEAPGPVRRQVSSGILRAYEQALKVFNRRHFAEAKELFEAIQHRYPQEVEIIARTQTYIQICVQKLARPNVSPRDADELYDRGVVALNIGDFTQARTLFEKALRLRPDEPHLLYSLAATHAQTGAHDQALDYLNRLIQIQPRYRAQAMNDADFSELHADKRFLEILGVSSPFDLLEARR